MNLVKDTKTKYVCINEEAMVIKHFMASIYL